MLLRASAAAGQVSLGLQAQQIPHRIVLHPEGVQMLLPSNTIEDHRLTATLQQIALKHPLQFAATEEPCPNIKPSQLPA